jgi:hypothetical protein
MNSKEFSSRLHTVPKPRNEFRTLASYRKILRSSRASYISAIAKHGLGFISPSRDFDAGKYTLLERFASSGRFPQVVSRGEMRILSDHEADSEYEHPHQVRNVRRA